jgi:hypothetical protein
VDIDGLRKTGNISYVAQGQSLSPAGYEQYVGKEFVPAGSKIAVSMPVTQVGKPPPATGASPFTPTTSTTPKPAAPSATTERPSKGGDGGAGATTGTSASSKSPIVESYQGTEGGKAAYTVSKHEDGSYSGTYADGSPMDDTAIDDTGVRFGGPLQPVSGPAPVRTPANTAQDIASEYLSKYIPKSEAGAKADAAAKYSDGKVDGALGKIDTDRAARDPAYAAGASEGRTQREAVLAAEKVKAETPAAETPSDSGSKSNKGGDNGPAEKAEKPQKAEKTEGEKEMERRGVTED